MFRSQAIFQPTIEVAGERLGISAMAVEKDYWVSQALRVLGDEFPDDFVFKGGTSLSKAYGLIERFSEDIDLLIMVESRGRGAIDRLMKDMGTVVGRALAATPASEHAERGKHRTYRIGYPTERIQATAIEPSVLLEMGVRGGAQPSRRVEIRTLLGDVLADAGTDVSGFTDLQRFTVSVLHPGRTLLEKLYAIHAEAIHLASDAAVVATARIGRHFYDVSQLLAADEVVTFLADDATVRMILEEIEDVSREHFIRGVPGELRPKGGFRLSPAFDVSSDIADRLRIAYESDMEELYYGTVPPPTWEGICRQVASTSV
ncbi:MAG: nucleotidyl transferase AbiEii/AbiGii toxin family protein [Actinomycetota bacterium]|nr:nucleotidyl transferase AbiEii/AbiGii toxin family protein [Actinomycetota bacterium]